MKYDTILFDADNTLLDFRRAEAEALKAVFRRHSLTLTPALKQAYQRINSGLWADFEAQRIAKDDIMRTRFQRLFDDCRIPLDGRSFNDDYMEELANGSFVIEGAETVCRALYPHCRLYLATNGVSKTQRRRFEGSGLAPWFSGVFVSDEAGAQKPMSAFFEYAFEHIPGADRSRMLMVGDTLSSDILGGKNAGIATCWFNPDGLPASSSIQADYEIRALPDLLSLLEGC